MISMEEFGNWLQLFLTIIMQEIPSDCVVLHNMPESTVYWKCKKWSMKIITRVFERFFSLKNEENLFCFLKFCKLFRYGSKGQVEEVYVSFAEYYSKEFLVLVVNCIMKNVLELYVQKKFVSNRVLHLAVNHLADAITHSQIWLIVKPHFLVLFSKNFIFVDWFKFRKF